jgi:hypothetical protein
MKKNNNYLGKNTDKEFQLVPTSSPLSFVPACVRRRNDSQSPLHDLHDPAVVVVAAVALAGQQQPKQPITSTAPMIQSLAVN